MWKNSVRRSVAIWLASFFVSGVVLSGIAKTDFEYIWIVMILGIPTLVTAKVAPVYGKHGRKADKIIVIARYLLIWFCVESILIQIDQLIGNKSMGAFFAILSLILIVSCIVLAARKIRETASHNTPNKTSRLIERKTIQKSTPKEKIPQRLDYINRIDKMEGHEFECFTADLLRKLGYERVEVTPGSGDQGVDVIAVKDGKRYAIQCKRYGQRLGNKPVQEVFAGKTIYGCSVAVVLTNNYFTEGAKEAAKATGVELWDRDTLRRMMDYANFKALV